MRNLSNKAIFLISLCFSFCCINIPETETLTPEKKIKLVSQKLNPGKFKDKMSGNYSVNIPEGYSAIVFYAGNLSKARFMAWSPDSVLHVANMNSGLVIALPDRNHDHIADTAIIAADNAFGHDLKFYKKDMYVAEERKVIKFSDKDGDGIYETRAIFIDSILPGKNQAGIGHNTRTIVFDEKRKKIYLSVGSSCNVCRETERAKIYEFDINGKNRRVFASGTRNCVGMTMNPETGELWATNNGSDYLGNDIPPEWIDVIRDGGFYGFPFAYGYQEYFDFLAHEEYSKILPLTAADSALVKKMQRPAALVQAHSAPMAIKFSNTSFRPYDKGTFVAYRGSWNREPPTGYKVVFLHYEQNKMTSVSDFITGFHSDSPNEKLWARPVGVETDLRGTLYMSSDDLTQFILALAPSR